MNLSHELALALGYEPEAVDLHYFPDCCAVFRVDRQWQEKGLQSGPERWHRFSYTDPTVYGPVLEWLLDKHFIHPRQWMNGHPEIHMLLSGGTVAVGATLPEAIARAAIAVDKERKARWVANEIREVLQP